MNINKHRETVARLKTEHPDFIARELAKNLEGARDLVNHLLEKGVSICPCIKGDILREYDDPVELASFALLLARFAEVEYHKSDTSPTGQLLVALSDHVLTRLDELAALKDLEASVLEV
jgi:hypothetical protein